jgi:hypothetical protein
MWTVLLQLGNQRCVCSTITAQCELNRSSGARIRSSTYSPAEGSSRLLVVEANFANFCTCTVERTDGLVRCIRLLALYDEVWWGRLKGLYALTRTLQRKSPEEGWVDYPVLCLQVP